MPDSIFLTLSLSKGAGRKCNVQIERGHKHSLEPRE
jgi:hypothetical protein